MLSPGHKSRPDCVLQSDSKLGRAVSFVYISLWHIPLHTRANGCGSIDKGFEANQTIAANQVEVPCEKQIQN